MGADLAGLGGAGQAGEVALPALGHRGGHQAGAGGAGQQVHQVGVADQAGGGRRHRAWQEMVLVDFSLINLIGSRLLETILGPYCK